MMFRRLVVVGSLAVLTLLFSTSAIASPIQYTLVDLISGVPSISGTITTDGTIGLLTQANVVDWDVTLYDGVNTGHETGTTPGDFTMFIDGPDLIATLTTITFNFSDPSAGFFEFNSNRSLPYPGAVCYTSTSNCWGPPAAGVYSVGGDGLSRFTSYSGTQVIANDGTAVTSTVPEPMTLSLVGSGLIGVIYRRRQNRRAING